MISQIVSILGNLRIFDVAVGLPGSMHDSTAWKYTAMYQNPGQYLAPNEWIWADSAYSLMHWVITPYKA